MSAAQIIAELPNLPPADLREVRQKLVELAEENEDAALCNATALEGARLLDRMEEESNSDDGPLARCK